MNLKFHFPQQFILPHTLTKDEDNHGITNPLAVICDLVQSVVDNNHRRGINNVA
jgi:hypothetical protein